MHEKRHHHSIAGQARFVANVALLLEAGIFTSRLIAQPTNAAAGEKISTASEMFLQAFVSRAADSGFWASICIFLILFVLLPTAIGLIMERPKHPQSVFGQTIARIAFLYLLQPSALFVQHISANFDERMFNVINGVALLMAFWEHISISLHH